MVYPFLSREERRGRRGAGENAPSRVGTAHHLQRAGEPFRSRAGEKKNVPYQDSLTWRDILRLKWRRFMTHTLWRSIPSPLATSAPLPLVYGNWWAVPTPYPHSPRSRSYTLLRIFWIICTPDTACQLNSAKRVAFKTIWV